MNKETQSHRLQVLKDTSVWFRSPIKNTGIVKRRDPGQGGRLLPAHHPCLSFQVSDKLLNSMDSLEDRTPSSRHQLLAVLPFLSASIDFMANPDFPGPLLPQSAEQWRGTSLALSSLQPDAYALGCSSWVLSEEGVAAAWGHGPAGS